MEPLDTPALAVRGMATAALPLGTAEPALIIALDGESFFTKLLIID